MANEVEIQWLLLLRLRLLQGDSSNVSEEYLRYQLPAQVGSFAPILGEVQSANKAVESYFYFDFDFYRGSTSRGDSSNVSEEDLSTSIQLRHCLRDDEVSPSKLPLSNVFSRVLQLL